MDHVHIRTCIAVGNVYQKGSNRTVLDDDDRGNVRPQRDCIGGRRTDDELQTQGEE